MSEAYLKGWNCYLEGSDPTVNIQVYASGSEPRGEFAEGWLDAYESDSFELH